MRTKLTLAGIALVGVAFGMGVTRTSADAGGDQNAEACTGQVIATLSREGLVGEGSGKVNLQDFHLAFIRQACAAGESVEALVQKVREAAEP